MDTIYEYYLHTGCLHVHLSFQSSAIVLSLFAQWNLYVYYAHGRNHLLNTAAEFQPIGDLYVVKLEMFVVRTRIIVGGSCTIKMHTHYN